MRWCESSLLGRRIGRMIHGLGVRARRQPASSRPAVEESSREEQVAWAVRWREARDLARLEASGVPLWKPNAHRLHRMARARALYR